MRRLYEYVANKYALNIIRFLQSFFKSFGFDIITRSNVFSAAVPLSAGSIIDSEH